MAIGTGTPYDLVVIGGGTAGLVGSKTAASFGARVLLIERDRPGGDCLWTGCVPSKSLLAMAELRGLHGDCGVTFDKAMDHVRRAIAIIEPVDSFAALLEANVDVRHEDASFIGPGRVMVGEEEVAFRQALIVTGAAPTIPDLPGLNDVAFWTSETIWDLPALPARLLILGGGAISCELGQAFARLGSEVTLVTRSKRLLAREDGDAAAIVQAAMERDGVHVMANRTIAQINGTSQGGAGIALLDNDEEAPFDAVLVALGRTPRSGGLNLASIGVDVDKRGYIGVDKHLRTSNSFVWAAGDVTAVSKFTHTAGVHASMVASNAVLGLQRSVSDVVPRVTFTSPELAAVGASTDASSLGSDHRVLTIDHAHLDRAITAGNRDGLTKLVVDTRGRLVGATIVGPRAGESLGEITLGISHGMRLRDIASVTHPYPTFNDAIWNAVIADFRDSLSGGLTSKAIPVLRTARSRWVEWRQARQER